MDNEERKEKIIDYIHSHAGYGVEECFNGVEAHMSRSTFFKILSELKADNKVIVENRNGRDQKLFLNKNDLLVTVPKELEQFELVFEQLFEKASDKVRTSMMEKAFNDVAKELNLPQLPDPSEHIPINQVQQLSDGILSIFFRVVDSYILRSLIIWPAKIQNRETLKKLYDIVFGKFANILLKFTEKSKNSSFGKTDLEYYIVERMRGAGFLLDLQATFNSVGMQKEIESIIDSLWHIDEEVQQLVYREPKLWGLPFNFKIDDWKKLIKLGKEYVDSHLDFED